MTLEFNSFDAARSLPEQRELFRDCFPEAIGAGVESGEHYRWKFHEFPTTPSSYEYAVWQSEQGKLVGYYAALPFRYSVSGTPFTCGMVCDVMTHSAARGQGIFTKIGRYATDHLQASGVDFTTGYPIRPEVLPGHLKVGWQVTQELPMYLKVLRSNAILRKSLARHLAPAVNVALRFASLVTRPRASTSDEARVISEPATEFLERRDSAYESFFRRWAASRRVHLIKDWDFLRWRLGAPGSKYHVISCRKGPEIAALAIVRSTDLKGIPCLAVLDLMLVEGVEAAAREVFREIELLAASLKCEAISIMISREGARRACLVRRGFIRTPFVFKLIVKILSERAKQSGLLAPSALDVMWIDSDDL